MIPAYVLVRHIAQDDPKQSALASDIIGQLSTANPGYITLIGLIVHSDWALN